MLTVDAPVMGKRERDMRTKGEEVSMGVDHGKDVKAAGGGVAQAISGYIDPNMTWDDIAWFRKACKLPLYLKGIQSVADVELAVKHGVEGVRTLQPRRKEFGVLTSRIGCLGGVEASRSPNCSTRSRCLWMEV